VGATGIEPGTPTMSKLSRTQARPREAGAEIVALGFRPVLAVLHNLDLGTLAARALKGAPIVARLIGGFDTREPHFG
jgi:hypothetical protein